MPLEIEKAEPNDDMQGEGDGAKNRGETDVRKGDIVTKEEVFNMSLFQNIIHISTKKYRQGLYRFVISNTPLVAKEGDHQLWETPGSSN